MGRSRCRDAGGPSGPSGWRASPGARCRRPGGRARRSILRSRRPPGGTSRRERTDRRRSPGIQPSGRGRRRKPTTRIEQESDMSKKVAYVTGGMGGIGTAVCRRLHDTGYFVIAGCGPSRDYNKWLAEQKADGYEFVASVGNVADWDSTKAAFDKVKAEYGNPDILVNNAGITRDGVFRKMSLDDWRAVIDTNLNSLFNVTKQVIDGMLEKGWG